MKLWKPDHEIKAVFLDIDGTIYHDGKLMESAKRAIAELQAREVPVALCTGRSILHTLKVQSEVEIDTAVYFNGGLAISKDAVIASHPLADDVVARAIDFSFERGLPIILHSRTRTRILEPFPNKFRPILEAFDFPPLQLCTVEDWRTCDEATFQINMFMTHTWDQRVQNDFPEVLLYRWDDEAVDLQKRGCDKIMGARALLDAWGIHPQNALHIGDGGNDIGMFANLGTSVAMGNASAEVQQHAMMVTDTVDQDGVCKALHALGLI